MFKRVHKYQNRNFPRGFYRERLAKERLWIREMWRQYGDNLVIESILAFLIFPACLFVSRLPDVFQLSGYTFSRTSVTFTSTAVLVIETVAPTNILPVTPSFTATPTPTQFPQSTPRPTATATSTPPPISDCQYLIFEGDTLGRIAQYFQVPIERIVRVNGLTNPNLIIAGSELIIPGSKIACPEGPIP